MEYPAPRCVIIGSTALLDNAVQYIVVNKFGKRPKMW